MTGLVDGETAGFQTTGSQTKVGDSANTYEITWAAEGNEYTAKAGNYTVKETVGTLKVTAQSIDPGDPNYREIKIDDPKNAEYDGKEHKWEPAVTDADGEKLTKGTDYEVTYDTK